MKGMIDAAAKDLSLVRGQPLNSDYIKDELFEIVANHEYEMQVIPQTSYIGSWIACFQGSLFKGNSNLRRTILGAGIQMMQQLTGEHSSAVPISQRLISHDKASTSSSTSAQPFFSS